MKKLIIFVLTAILLFTAMSGSNNILNAATVFKDVPENAWYYEQVQIIANDSRKIMVGYGDEFGPMDSLTVEQFIKIAVTATGTTTTIPSGQYWATQYIQKGLNLGFVLPGEFRDYRRPITREEMARIIIRSLPTITGEKGTVYDISSIKKRMLDYDTISSGFTDYVCQAYEMGILIGSNDKKFHPNDKLTRAEAATVINRMLDASKRVTTQENPGQQLGTTHEFWTDSEFEKYMKDNADDFYCIGKIENRKIYWKYQENLTPTLLDETQNPGINTILYDYVKHMAYFAKKYSNDFGVAYDESYGGSLLLRYNIISRSSAPYGDISLFVYTEPQINHDVQRYAPGKQKDPSYYEWMLGTFRSRDYLSKQGFEWGMNARKFKWTETKYEEIFRQACIDMYGFTQGNAFYTFVMPKYLETFYEGGELEDSYFGSVPDSGVELSYYYSHKNHVKETRFWSTKPEGRK